MIRLAMKIPFDLPGVGRAVLANFQHENSALAQKLYADVEDAKVEDMRPSALVNKTILLELPNREILEMVVQEAKGKRIMMSSHNVERVASALGL